MGGDPWEPKGSNGRGPLGAQWIPLEGTLGSPRDPDPREPMGFHGVRFSGFHICHGCVLYFDLFWEHPGTTEDQFGGSWGKICFFFACPLFPLLLFGFSEGSIGQKMTILGSCPSSRKFKKKLSFF